MRSVERLHWFARRLCSHQSMTRIVEPLLADMTHDLASTQGWKERLITRARWEAAFLVTTVHCSLGDGRQSLRADNGAGARTLTTALGTFIGITLLLIGIMLIDLSTSRAVDVARFSVIDWLRAAAYLLPQGIVVLPLSLLLASLWSIGRDRQSARRTLAVLTVLAAGLSLALLFVIPDANQSYRELVFAGSRPPARGANELPLAQLVYSLSHPAWFGPQASTSSLWLAFHSRMAIVCSPLIFGALAVASSRSFSRAAGIAAGVLAVGAHLFYFTWDGILTMTEAGRLSPFLAAWMPNLVAAALLIAFKLMPPSRDAAAPDDAVSRG